MNHWLDRRVVGLAHQGGSFEGPSSTLYAMRAALEVGCRAIELDLHATRDRQLVVGHDATVDRTTQGRGAIAELTLSELRGLDNAYWWVAGEIASPGREASAYRLRGRAPADRDLGVATLGEVLDALPGVLINLDIKGTDPDVEPYEELLARELRERGAADRVIVASFHDRALARFRALAPEVATSAGTLEATDFYVRHCAGDTGPWPFEILQVPARINGVEVVTASFVEAAHRAGVAVHVWTINDEAEMARLVDLGVDGVVSDRPSVLQALLHGRGIAWAGLEGSG